MRGATPARPYSLTSVMHLIHRHVRGYSTSSLPQTQWVHNYFTWRSQCLRVHNVCSVIPDNCGVLQGAVHSPFILHTSYLLSELLASFIKYTNHVVIGHHCRDSQDISTINDALKYVYNWSGENGLNFNPSKCIQCMSFLKGNAVTNPNLKATINGNALSTVESVTYFGVTFSN